jgi:uncharacterized RDD family membrane protein YckC
MVVAAIIGKIGVSRWIGASVVHEDPEIRAHAFRSFVIGSVVIIVAYMIPILGFVAWTLGGMFGLGAATLAFMRAYRRENPAAPKPVPPPVVVAPPVAAAPPVMQYEEIPVEPIEPSVVPLAAPAQPLTPPLTPLASDVAMLPHAAFLDRLAAFALDMILVLIAVQIFSWGNDDDTARAYFLTLLVYHIGFWTWKGTTVGGIICQLRVVRTDGAPLKFVDALVRGLSAIFSLAVFALGALWILKDPERQAWHDRIAGTYVVKVPRNWPL